MILGKLRKEAALYASIAGVSAGLVLTFFTLRFLLSFWLSLVLLARAYGDVPPDQRPDNLQFLLEAIRLAFSA